MATKRNDRRGMPPGFKVKLVRRYETHARDGSLAGVRTTALEARRLAWQIYDARRKVKGQ